MGMSESVYYQNDFEAVILMYSKDLASNKNIILQLLFLYVMLLIDPIAL